MKRISIFATSILGLCFSSPGAPRASAQSLPACDTPWTAGMSVTVGELVSYDSDNYQALQAEASAVSNWQPPNVPALWSLVGPCSSGTTTPGRY